MKELSVSSYLSKQNQGKNTVKTSVPGRRKKTSDFHCGNYLFSVTNTIKVLPRYSHNRKFTAVNSVDQQKLRL